MAVSAGTIPKPEQKPKYFRSFAAFSGWLVKNNLKKNEVWILIYKKGYTPVSAREPLTASSAWDVALIHGWTEVLTRRIDHASYQIKFVKRKKGSVWSARKIKRYQDLKKAGRISETGALAFRQRDKVKSQLQPAKFSKAQVLEFREHKDAWDFFKAQAPGYQKGMRRWVTSAKRPQTQRSRLAELIRDSSEYSILKRIVRAIEKTKPVYPPGKTPIETAKNIGPTLGAEFRASGIETVETLKRLGWEDAFFKLIELHPHRFNLNVLLAVIGAVETQNKKSLDPEFKSEAKSFLRQLRRDLSDF